MVEYFALFNLEGTARGESPLTIRYEQLRRVKDICSAMRMKETKCLRSEDKMGQ